MYCGWKEEGDKCPESNCAGKMGFLPTVDCSCHINPPCDPCVNKLLTCDACGWEQDDPEPHYVMAAPEISIVEHKPRALDKKKIDFRIKGHSSSSMVKEGCYPCGTTRKEVEAVVRGTFGGRFEFFRENKFKYIAYTD